MSGYRTPDYTGVAEASALPLRAMTGMIGQVGDYFKQQGEKKKLIKKSDVQIDAALKLFPDLAPALQGYRDQLKDENLPLDDRMAIADSVSKVIDLGIGEMRNASNLLMRQQRLGLEQQYKAAQLGMRAEEIGIQKQKAAAEAGELKESEISIFDPEINDTRSEKVWINKQGQAFDYDTKKPIINKEKYFYGEEGGLGELPPTSQIAPSGQINQSALSSPLRKYAGSFEEYGNEYGVDPALLAAIAEHETGGGKSSAFRNKNNAMGVSNASGPIKMESVEASIEKMASLLGRGINEGRGPYANAKSIEDIGRKYAPIGAGNDPRNLNQFWTRGVRSKYEKLATPKQIDNAASMSQTAIGTPDEQAKVAHLIQEGQSMQTVQMIPQGAMGTESSISTQQPQLPQPQRRMVRGIPTGRDKSGARFRIATPEEAARFGVPAGQIDETTGRFYPVSQPSGNTFTAEIDPKTGKVVFSQGPTKAQQAAEAEAKAEEKAKLTATGVTQDLYELKKRYTDLSAGTGPIPALSRLGASAVPGTPAAEVKEVADRVTAGLTIENIMSARRSNAAGAALGGSTSDKDMKILEKATTSLNAVQNPEAFNREWTRIMEAQLNIAYGTPEQRAKLVKENKITEEFNKEIEDLYPAETINIKGELVPRREKSAPNIKSLINPEVQAILDKFSKGQ